MISASGFGVITFALNTTVSKGTGVFMASFILVVLDSKGLSLGLREFGENPCGSRCFKAKLLYGVLPWNIY